MTVSNYRDSRRRFTEAERSAAFLAANGRCSVCGCALGKDFHADHIRPHARGGETHIDNLQALCPECNMKKGDSSGEVVMPTRPGRVPREWQQKAFSEVLRKISQKSVLIQATPGAGKTGLACGVARYLMDEGWIDRVLVVAPSINLREGWARDMSAVGIELDPDSAGGLPEAKDYHGRAVTYSALAAGKSGSDVERMRQRDHRTLGIIDEAHHSAEHASWGIGLQNALNHAVFVLCLSGTPFRSDGRPIPFVTYDQDGNAVADYVYSYSEAIADVPQVCRQVYFPAYEGDLKWLDGDAIYQHSFADELDEKNESRRLRTALMADDWARKTLAEANRQLLELRCSHPDAGGLVVAMDQRHANYLAGVMRDVCHTKPLVVVSDTEDAHAKIDAFRDSPDPWVIAVKMISEGVDIARLRVCVYMTNVVTELFFRQVVGRVVRMIHHKREPAFNNQSAFFYIPADRRLVAMAARIQDERIQGVVKASEAEEEDDEEGKGGTRPPPSWRILSGTSWHDKTIDFEGRTFSTIEIEQARPLAQKYGVRAEVMAVMIRDGIVVAGTVNGERKDDIAPAPLYERKRNQRKSQALSSAISEIRNRHLSGVSSDEEAFSLINRCLNRAVLGDGRKRNQATEAERDRMEQLAIAASMSRSTPAWLR